MNISQRHFLRPPGEESDDTVEVGVVTLHPCLSRIAYATRTRTDQSYDLFNAEIVVQDFATGQAVCSFNLQELTNSMNESQSPLVASESTHPRESEIQQSLSSSSSISTVSSVTVKSLGAVQSLTFLDRESILSTVAPQVVHPKRKTWDKDRPPFLMIGFKRCIIVVSVFKLEYQLEAHARGVSVFAYIGPNDLDEYDRGKRKSKQPASTAVPVSEHIISYGCYDGSIRFYDLLKKKQARSLVGPTGRNDPVCQIVNANRKMLPNDATRNTDDSQSIRPRIVAVSASGVAFVWELDLSINPSNGEILRLVIPPPLARIDGVKAVTGVWGIPTKPLSPCPSYDQLDVMNSVFELSYDPHGNTLFWTLSSEFKTTALVDEASSTRDGSEAVDPKPKKVAFALWSLANLPASSLRPPPIAHLAVIELPYTTSGRVPADMVLPGYLNGANSNSLVSSIYGSASGDIMLAVADIASSRDSLKVTADTTYEANILVGRDRKSRFGSEIHAITASRRLRPTTIAVGTHGGVIIASIAESGDGKGQQISKDCKQYPSYEIKALKKTETDDIEHRHGNKSKYGKQNDTDATLVGQAIQKISELELCNSSLRQNLESLRSELRRREGVDRALEEERIKHELDFVKVKSLESELKGESQSSDKLQNQVTELQKEVKRYNCKLEQQKECNESANKRLDTTMDKIESLRKELRSNDISCQTWRDENDELRRKLEEATCSLEIGKSENETLKNEQDKSLQEHLVAAMEIESALRSHIQILEEDRTLMDQELDLSKKKVEENNIRLAVLQDTITEKGNLIDALVKQHEKEKKEHAMAVANNERQIEQVRKEIERYAPESTTAFADEASAKDEIAELKAENANLKEEALQASGLYVAMKVELQNALNDLAEYRREQSDSLTDSPMRGAPSNMGII